MDRLDIIKSITERTNGDIYFGVVGAVRTGKSTFIKKVIENKLTHYRHVPNVLFSSGYPTSIYNGGQQWQRQYNTIPKICP